MRLQALVILVTGLGLTACKNGGNVTLESTNRNNQSQSSPYVQVNQGGQSLIVQTGQTANTGVHGWVTIQAVTSQNLVGGSVGAVVNHSQAFE